MILMKGKKIVNTSDTIVSKIEKGSFRFPIQFELFGHNQNIAHAAFDTGCSHSLISVSSLDVCNKNIRTLEHEALMDVNIPLAVGAGIESNSKETVCIRKYVKEINLLKRQLRKLGKSQEECRHILEKKITATIEDAIHKI